MQTQAYTRAYTYTWNHLLAPHIRTTSLSSSSSTGKDVVFHCAAITPTRENDKNKTLMHAVNVGGTRNVIAACQEHGVGRLVFTSSSSVVYEGRDLVNVDETHPYAARPMDYYRCGGVYGLCVNLV